MHDSWLPPQWRGRERIAHPVKWARLPEFDVGIAQVQTKADHGHENRWYLYFRKFNEGDVKAFPVLASTVITSSPGSTQTITSDATWNIATNTIEVIGAGARGAIGASTSTSGGGGGAGAYTKITNTSITTPGTTQYFARVGGTTATNGSAGGDTWWTLTSPGTSYPASGTAVGARGGAALASSSTPTGGAGGSNATSSSFPECSARRSGGNAGASASGGGGGGYGDSTTAIARRLSPTAALAMVVPLVARARRQRCRRGRGLEPNPDRAKCWLRRWRRGGNAAHRSGAWALWWWGGGGRSNGTGGGAQGVVSHLTPIFTGSLVTTEGAVRQHPSPAQQPGWQRSQPPGRALRTAGHFDGADASTIRR
jgi:hypothetical protein